MRHIPEPLGGERAICSSRVYSEVSVIAVWQVRQIGSVLKLIGEVEDRPKLIGEGFLFEQVRIFEEAEQKRPL